MDQRTIDTYDAMAREYDTETADFWNLFPRDFLDRFIAESGPHVLDIGSGPGRDGLLLQAAGKQVICLDASQVMVELSRERGLESIVGDLLALPCADRSFDAAWAYTSLLHVRKSEFDTALSEIRRVLVPGGILGLGLIEGDTELYRESSGVSLPRWFSFFEKDEVIEHARTSGFELVHFDSFTPRSKRYLHFLFRA